MTTALWRWRPHDTEGLTVRVPLNRTVVVTFRRRANDVGAAFAASSAPRSLVLPREFGTAAEVLLAAHWIHRQDPRATVALFPADLAVTERRVAMPAAAFVDRYPRWIVLLGAAFSGGGWKRGWSTPAEVLTWTDAGPVWRVHRVVGAALPATARARAADGWRANTGIFVAKATQLVEAGRVFLPRLHRGLLLVAPLPGTAAEALAMRRAWAGTPRPDFAQSLLEPCTPSLAVVEIAATAVEGRTWA